ncbi:MAG: hypothetical protein H7330_10285 [Hymenobacteraceae bacterium]|nr:hypothetical protein [Hymenobacteraceae bacterium]
MLKLARIAIWICLIANAAVLALTLISKGFRVTGFSSLLFLYLWFAELVAPVLFIVSIVGAPRGTFRIGWPADDAPVRRFRWLFWGNMVLATVFFSLFFGGFLRP